MPIENGPPQSTFTGQILSPTHYRRVVFVLVVGFSIVILLLAAALLVAYLRTHTLQRGSAAQVRAHLVTAGLADQLQLQRQRINSLLFRAARYPNSRPNAFIEEIRNVEAEVHRISGEARSARLPGEWNAIEEAMAKLRRQSEISFALPPVDEEELDELSASFERFVQLTAAIVRADSERSIQLDHQIEAASSDVLRDFFLLTGVCILIAGLCAFITIRTTNQTVRQLEWQASELNRVSWHMLETQEAAARRFSHEMHDELGQSLTGLKAFLSGLKAEDFGTRRPECVHLLEEAIGNVRELSQLLRPIILDDFGLDAGLHWLSERFTMRTGIQVHYFCTSKERPREEIETHFFRIAQEALTNVARHSGATEVEMEFRNEGEVLRLIVEDNGHGMKATSNGSHSLGMVGMGARARQVGGAFSAGKGKSGGVRIEVAAPSERVAS